MCGNGALRRDAACAYVHAMEHKTDTIHVRVGPRLREQLARLADQEERPLSVWVRRALREAAQRAGGERPADRAA